MEPRDKSGTLLGQRAGGSSNPYREKRPVTSLGKVAGVHEAFQVLAQSEGQVDELASRDSNPPLRRSARLRNLLPEAYETDKVVEKSVKDAQRMSSLRPLVGSYWPCCPTMVEQSLEGTTHVSLQ